MKKLFLNICILITVNSAYTQSVGIGTDNPSGKFHISNSPSGSDALFFVDTTGNVGIGTKHPQNKLDVAGRITAQSAKIVALASTLQPFRVEDLVSMIDQQQPFGNLIEDNGFSGWQSFTAGKTGTLDSVALPFHPDFTPASATLRIYSGEGISGPLLFNATFIPLPGSSVVSPYLNVHVVAGTKYTIYLRDQIGWLYAAIDVYNGGKTNASLDGDRCFQTYVSSPASRLMVDNDGNVGIGTDNATEKLVVQTTTHNYGLIHTNGSITLGTYVGGNSSFGGWIGTKSNHPLMFFTNNGSPQLTILQNGNIGIGTITPAYKLHVSGLVAANDFVSMSDARLKKDIIPLKNALSTVLQLNGVSYYWNRESFPQYQFDNNHKIGFLAQEIEKIIPDLVATGTDGYKTVNYIEIVPLLVESIKEQQRRIDQQLEINESLKARLDKLEKMRADKK